MGPRYRHGTTIFLSISIAIISCLSLPAAAPTHGNERLRELAVFPAIDISCNYAWNLKGCLWRIGGDTSLSDDIAEINSELKNDPQNIQKFLQKAFLLSLNDQTNELTACLTETETKCRKLLASRPRNGLLQVQLGTILEGSKPDEAESILRKSVLTCSNEWRCWAELAAFLQRRAFYASCPPSNFGTLFSDEGLKLKPSPEDAKKTESISKEAADCMSRAMALAGTNEPDAYIYRASFGQASNMTVRMMKYYRDGKPLDASEWTTTGFFPHDSVVAIGRAADLEPKSAKLTGFAAYLEWAEGFSTEGFNYDFEALNESVRRHIHLRLAHLDALSDEPDKKTAASALFLRAMFNPLIKGPSSLGIDYAHRAVLKDPDREQLWNLWMGLLLTNVSPDELVSACKMRLKQKNSAQNHLLLAKTLVKQSKWDEAKTQTEAALKLETNNIVAHLMMVALVIRQSTDAESLEESLTNLTQIDEIYKKMPDSDEKVRRWREWTLNNVIYDALMPDPDERKDAKANLVNFLSYFPDDEDAKKIREAME